MPLKEATRLKPDYVVAFDELGYAYYKIGQNNDAITAYTQSIKLKPDVHTPYFGPRRRVLPQPEGVSGSIAQYQKAFGTKRTTRPLSRTWMGIQRAA